ncbi:EpsG family protein [Undibacterium squillarum]|uniref:EpsG family protein n=1 Tax=Undibacterium squillarum TaxID=1131567 RepID=UPI0016761DDA
MLSLLNNEKKGYTYIKLTICFLAIFLILYLYEQLTGDFELFRGDASYYFSILQDDSWKNIYELEPTMFWILSIFNPDLFSQYIIIVIGFNLTLLTYIIARKKISIISSILILSFFSFSFYGIHLGLNFQRQLFSISFFLYFILEKRLRILAACLSILSHQYAFLMFLFYFLCTAKLNKNLKIFFVLFFILIFTIISNFSFNDAVSTYGEVGAESSFKYAAKQLVNTAFFLFIKYFNDKKDTSFVDSIDMYIILSVPSILSPIYAGIFSRIDYYLVPYLIFLWQLHLPQNNRSISYITLTLFILLTGFLWWYLNFEWIFNAIE